LGTNLPIRAKKKLLDAIRVQEVMQREMTEHDEH
jgi:hypothetical protein